MHGTPPVHIKPDAFAPLPDTKPVPLMQATGCRWPVSDHPYMFCNAIVHHTLPTDWNAGRISSFCQHHHKIAYPKASSYNPLTLEGKKMRKT
jgi:hypothetical protein